MFVLKQEISVPTEPAVESSVRTHSPRWALAGLSLSALLSALGTSITNVGLPTLARAFEASFQDVQWVVLAYLLTVTALIVGAGRLGDIVGRRRLLLSGIALFTLASGLAGLAPTLWLLIAARAVQGLGAAIMMALTMAFVAETVPKERTGGAMGLLGTMSAVGTALGPSLGGALIAGSSWRALFFVNMPLGILAYRLAQRHLPADRPRATTAPARLDVPGTIVLALTLAAYALAMTIGRGHFGALNFALVALAILGIWVFVRVETRAVSPLVHLAMFREPALSTSLATNGLVSTVMMTTLVVGPFYLARSLGLDAAATGLVMSMGPVVAAISGVPAGRLVDRFGTRPVTMTGLAAIATGTAALSVLPASLAISGYLGPIAIITAGYALFQAANNTAVMGGVAGDRRGVVSGLLNLSRNLGLVTGASAMGAVFVMVSAASDIALARPGAIASGMRVTFAAATGLVLLAIVLVLAGRALAASSVVSKPPRET